MQLNEAREIAERRRATLAPHCERIEIAGSIRRCRHEVGDIEIVCIPKRDGHQDLFGVETCRTRGWCDAVASLGVVTKGHIPEGRYIQIELPEGITLDLFTAVRDNWGLILAIRTGSADFAHHVLACGWVRAGYKSVDGMLTRYGLPVPMREEEDVFRAAGVTWTEPEYREWIARDA